MFITADLDSRKIVTKLVDYMKGEGLSFSKINLDDSSPYAILNGKSSVGYRERSKWNKTGIVFFCTKADADNLSRGLNVTLDDNSNDKTRPYAVFVRDNDISEAVKALKKNPLNTVIKSVSESRTNKEMSKDSYQYRYWDEYYPYVQASLAKDGYSNSDSNTETAVRDTFYLERKDSTDFLEWFKDEETVAMAKVRLAELLTQANRKSSNLSLDLKYYSRDIDYFAKFIWGIQGVQKDNDSPYSFIKIINDKPNVKLIRDNRDGSLYVRKEYLVYNQDVFTRLKEANIDGLPNLIEVSKKADRLFTIEEYVEGNTLLELFKTNGPFDEDKIKSIALSLCRILKQLHGMNPQLIHRDIKPSNIMIDKSGKVYLIDFNASKEFHEDTSEDTFLYGTQYFAAPEQLIGYMASTPSTDIFGLGATLSYLMTGMYHSQALAIGKYNRIFKKCVEMNPKDRYQTVDEIEQDFIMID